MAPGYVISTDKTRLDLNVIHSFLSQESYWASNIPRTLVEQSIEHSLCFGVYFQNSQVGFARVISDFATFAYLADVFILPEHRGKGLSKWLIHTIVDHSDLQGLRRFLLATRDAHSLYEQFGFAPLDKPEIFMQRRGLEKYD